MDEFGKNGTILGDLDALSKVFDKYRTPGNNKVIVFTDGDVRNSDDTFIFLHEAMHATTFNGGAMQSRDPNGLRDLMGHPAGYVPTPAQEEALAIGLAELKEEWALTASRETGEKLAEACHGGVSQATSCMRPLSLKPASRGFMAVGVTWQ